MATDTLKIDILNPVIIIIFYFPAIEIIFLKIIYKKEIKNVEIEYLKIQTLTNGII
jgi:hypothetical protein